MKPTWYSDLSARSGRPEVRAVITRLIGERQVRVEPMPGDCTRVRVVPLVPVQVVQHARYPGLAGKVASGPTARGESGTALLVRPAVLLTDEVREHTR